MAEFSTDEQLNKFLLEHSDKEFVRRVLDPSLNVNPVQNEDGSTSSHSMAAEVDEEGNWFVFPTVVNKGDRLERLKNPDGSVMDGQQARRANMETGELISFGKDKNGAIAFSQLYKPKAFKEFFLPAEKKSVDFTLSDFARGNR